MKLVAKWICLVSNNLEFSSVIIIMSSPPPPQSHAKIKFKPRQFFIFLSRVPKKNTSLLSPIVAMHATINLILMLKVNEIFSCEHTETCIFYHIIPMQACILRKPKKKFFSVFIHVSGHNSCCTGCESHGGPEVLPHMGYIGMCEPKLRVWFFSHFSQKQGKGFGKQAAHTHQIFLEVPPLPGYKSPGGEGRVLVCLISQSNRPCLIIIHIIGVSKCFVVGGQLWKSRPLW